MPVGGGPDLWGEPAKENLARRLCGLGKKSFVRQVDLQSRTECVAVGSINVIRGGGSQVNIIPDFCEVEFDRRVMPGECSKNVLCEMESVVSHFSEASGDAIRIESPFTLEPMDSETHGDLKERVCAMLCARGCDATPQGAPWATNASHYGTILPAVVLGPGDIAQAHTKDEWIALSQLDLAGRLYLDLMLRG